MDSHFLTDALHELDSGGECAECLYLALKSHLLLLALDTKL